MNGQIPKTRRRKKKKDFGIFLDRIIDKYSGTPQYDPDFVDYSMRPTREEMAEEQIDHITRTHFSA
jgi:hypothetical protein